MYKNQFYTLNGSLSQMDSVTKWIVQNAGDYTQPMGHKVMPPSHFFVPFIHITIKNVTQITLFTVRKFVMSPYRY